MNEPERGLTGPMTAAARGGDLAARYRSLFEIGRGGMGTIEVALEGGTSGFERIVALKRLHPHSARERRQTEAFVREARLAVWLVHPNVVHAFDFGEIGGDLFLAMEYVEGETLSALVRTAREQTGAPPPPALVASILADTCEGLHAAHELRDQATGAPLNVIHRDVSPHNVMISYEGHVKLLDFGVAKMDLVDPLTRTGEVKGKTAYMSPEQAMGDPLDRRSDLFSLGAVLFECIAGWRMWGNGTDLDVIRKLALESPPSLADAAPLAPPELVDLCARLVSRAPGDRPANARVVADELRAFVAKSEPTVNAAAVASAMHALFAGEAARRKEMLDRALEQVGPGAKVDVLRRSLAGPTALAALSQPPPPPRPSPPRVSATSDAPRPIDTPPTASMAPRATGRGVVVSAVVGLAVAVAIVAMTNARSTRSSVSLAASTSPPASPTPPPAPVAPRDASPAASTAPAIPASAVTAVTTAPSAPPSPPPHHHPRPHSSAPAVDVDTNPL